MKVCRHLRLRVRHGRARYPYHREGLEGIQRHRSIYDYRGRRRRAHRFSIISGAVRFLAVATSSNGEGDPPYNFHPFLKALYEADDAGDKPLTGCGFAVLGFGCSCFDAFKNCPG